MKIKRRTVASIKTLTIRTSLLIIFFGAIYIYLQSDVFTIKSYEIQGVNEVVRIRIDQQLHDAAHKKTFGVLPNNKIFTYSNTNIITIVRTNVYDVATIDMRPVGLHTVRISITLLTPLFRLEGKEAITESGIIFTTDKDLSMYPHVTVASSTKQTIKIQGLPFTVLTVDGKNLDAPFLNSLSLLSSKVTSLVFPVTDILIEETGDISLFDVHGKSKVIFLEDMDQKKVWSTLVSALDTDPLKTKLATDKGKLEYLDVRYGNKVFYRFSDMTFQNKGETGILDDHAAPTQATSTIPH